MSWEERYEVRVDKVPGGCQVYVTARASGLCLWHLPLAWPLTVRGRYELWDTEQQLPGMKRWELEQEIKRQMKGGKV